VNWQRLDMLGARFRANCDALATRDAELAGRLRSHRPSAQYVIATQDERVHLARLEGTTAHVIPCRLPPVGAQQVAQQLCLTGRYHEPVLVAGIDQGWLWHFLYQLPAEAPACPGYRAPLFFLVKEIKELWIAAHLHDWRQLLADARVQILVGADAYSQVLRTIDANPRINIPRLSVTLDPAVWPAGKNLDVLTSELLSSLNARLGVAGERLKALYAANTDASIAARLRSGAKLRVLGLTARFTTFLQHSMRDWLAAFAAMGHETRLLIEQADHEQLNSLVVAEMAAEFRPDLILMIDHYRGELGGMPATCPAVMWVQDYLPNIFNKSAGAAQTPYDYVIGYNRTECTTKFDYPASRFLSVHVGVNEERFAPPDLNEEDRRRFECDISFVGHASKPAEAIIREAVEQTTPEAKPLLMDAFERLRAVYAEGHALTHPLHIRGIIEQACVQLRLAPDADSLQRITDLFTHRINNALFRHQALGWAADAGVNLHVYGNGWEQNPRFARFARGPADNATALRKIYRASRINLQAIPHGSVHQRLLEGLCAGGFFLCRYVPGDVLDRTYEPLWAWCRREGVSNDEQLIQRATPDVLRMLGELQRTIGIDPFKLGVALTDDMRLSHDNGYIRTAILDPEHNLISFDSRAVLHQRITHFLDRPQERQAIAKSMRERVLERLTYRATTRRVLEFIANDLAGRAKPQEAAA
jgi:hypothetical protein